MQEGGGAPVTRAPAPKRTLLLATVALAVAYDQVSKALAAHLLADGRPMRILGTLLDLQLTRNPGGAFGLFPNSPVLFLALTAVIVGAVVVLGLRSGQAPIPLGLVAGGGLGNLIDRVVRAPGHLQGRVVDFIHFRYWPTFNLADSSIVVGVGLLLALELRRSRA